MRRTLKVSAWTVLALVVLTAVLIGGVLVGGNTDMGRRAIERLTAQLTSGQVQLTGLSGSFPSHLTLTQLQLRDARGVWLTADHVAVDWSVLALLERRIQVDVLTAAALRMDRLPVSHDTPRSKPATIPRIDAASVAIDRVTLGAELAGTEAVLTLRGGAHLRSIDDMTFDAAARRIGGEGDYRLNLHFDAKHMDAVIKLHEPASGPLEHILGIPGLGALDADASLKGPRMAEQLSLVLDAGTLHGTAQGTFNLTDLSADVGFDFDSKSMSPRPDLTWDRAAFHGRWHGSVKTPTADGHLDIDGLRLPGDTSMAKLNADIFASLGAISLKAVIAALRIPGPAPDMLKNGPVKIDASMRIDDEARPLDVSASHRLFLLRGQAVTAGKQSATVDMQLFDLKPLAAIAHQNLSGTAGVKAEVQLGQPTRVKIKTVASSLKSGEVWAGLIGDRATVDVAGSFDEATVTLDSLKAAGRFASLGASGSVTRASSALKLQWDLNVANLAMLSPALGGTLKGSGSIWGPTNALALDAKLSSTLAVRGSQNGDLSADVRLRGLPDAANGTLSVRGSLDGSPLNVQAAVERGGARSTHVVLRDGEWKSASVDGDVMLADALADSHGQLHLKVAELGDLQHLLGTELSGSLSGDVALVPGHGQSKAQLKFDAQDLKVGEFAGNVELTGEGTTDALKLKLDAQTPNINGFSGTGALAGTLDMDAQAFSLSSTSVKYRGQEVRLLAPAKIDFSQGLAVDELRLGAQKAVFDLKGMLSPTLDMRASLRQVQPSLVNAFAPDLLAAGDIEARVELHGSLSSPSGEVSVDATGLRMADDAAIGLPPVDVRAKAALKEGAATVDARLIAGSASHLSVTGEAPLTAGGSIDLKVGGDVDVGLINPLLEARGQQATGKVHIDTTVGGTIAQPQIGGEATLAQGTFHDYGRGVSISDITAELIGKDGTLQIKSLTAAAAPGTISVTGTLGALEPGLPLDLKITAKNAQPVVSKLVTANFDADLQVKGKARERLDVAGTVHLNRTVIGIPNSLPPNVAVLDVRRRRRGAPAVPEKQLVVGLDIAVNAPQEMLVQGRGLDAEMEGDLHISGTTDTPLVDGGFKLVRGSFSLSSNKLNFTSGQVSFNGAGLRNKIDPTLDFVATSTVTSASTTAIATLTITGFADAPQFAFTSSPDLPPDEIMALLLFGAPASQLSALQLAQIGAALASLSGVGGGGGLNPLAKIQKSLGLDRLNVGAGTTTNTGTGTENSGASIEAGRYVSKRVYIEAKQSTTGSSQVEADIDLTKHLKLQTRLGNGTGSIQGTTPDTDPGSSIGLTYQFEY